MAWLFPVAYTLSGFAGLIYEVSWTRLLTLYIGHSTAAASAVVAAFLGGLAVGAFGGGRVAARLPVRSSLHAYIALEGSVALLALALPFELQALEPVLRWSYDNGDPGLLFPFVRILACGLMVFLPALALGATFPMAIRWFATHSANPAQSSGALYAANTIGAAAGSVLAGFVLIPTFGLARTTHVGVAVSVLTAGLVWIVLRTSREPSVLAPGARSAATASAPSRRTVSERQRTRERTDPKAAPPDAGVIPDFRWLVAGVVGLSGFAALAHEIAWTRILSLVLGPTIYAFSATVAAVIGGMALGSAGGTWLAGRSRSSGAWLALALLLAAITTTLASVLVGDQIPRLVAQQVADAPDLFNQLLRQGTLLTLVLIVPTAACLGAAFPLGLALAAPPRTGLGAPAAEFGAIYAVNTVGAVLGSLASGFLFIPRLGLQSTLTLVTLCLGASALLVIVRVRLPPRGRSAALLLAAVAGSMVLTAPAWDHDLLASGVYLYAPDVPRGLDREAMLKAGTLLYYKEGASATVSVKRLTGTTTLAVDGKVDASNRRDMLTQKLIAHLPLLLHDHPQQVGIIGLGSGVTLGAALRHPITRADVVELSPEVVEASENFATENDNALQDPRAHLIVGDGRSHLLLSNRQYDVIVSEPSNPWIAGVATLFTREFFLAARARLAPGGIICQWAHTYNISSDDLRSIVATFHSVFPEGTMWLVGGDDVLLVASTTPLEGRLKNVARAWTQPEVAADLKSVGVVEPFSLLSLFAGGPAELDRYTRGAAILSDDRVALEFSAPRELHKADAADNSATLQALLDPAAAPAAVRQAMASAGAAQWRNRGAMFAKSDVDAMAYDDYVRALQRDRTDQASIDGFVRAATLVKRQSDALSWLKSFTVNETPTVPMLIATSQLLGSNGMAQDALHSALEASALDPVNPAARAQLASLYADAGALSDLDTTVAALQRLAPAGAATFYYDAVSSFLHGRSADAVSKAERAVRADPAFAAVYDLLGAAHTKLGHADQARRAFASSLHYDAHDSTAYANLGLLALTAGDRRLAANYFAEALWLEPDSTLARQGLAQAK